MGIVYYTCVACQEGDHEECEGMSDEGDSDLYQCECNHQRDYDYGSEEG